MGANALEQCVRGKLPPTSIFTSFRPLENWKKSACEGTQAVLAILHGKGFSLFRHCGKNYKFFPQCPHRGDITLATINIRNSGERG